MGEKKMIEIPYEDFTKLMRTAGRVEAALAILRSETGTYVKCPDMIAILDGEETTIHANVTGQIDE
nr:MAG TPA: hypothetical protein [Caudoviricetes sp.]